MAQLLIEKKMGKFQPSEFKDHYETALKALIKAKKAGRKIKEMELPEQPTKPSSVLEALRESLKQGRSHARRAPGSRSGDSTDSPPPCPRGGKEARLISYLISSLSSATAE